MNVEKMKEKLVESMDVWIDSRLTDMAQTNPALTIPAVYMKRAARNLLARNREKIGKQVDMAALFIADEKGEVDTDTVMEDLAEMLRTMPEQTFEMGWLTGSIGDGKISIELPDNMLTAIMLGSKRSIGITPEDIAELRALMAE